MEMRTQIPQIFPNISIWGLHFVQVTLFCRATILSKRGKKIIQEFSDPLFNLTKLGKESAIWVQVVANGPLGTSNAIHFQGKYRALNETIHSLNSLEDNSLSLLPILCKIIFMWFLRFCCIVCQKKVDHRDNHSVYVMLLVTWFANCFLGSLAGSIVFLLSILAVLVECTRRSRTVPNTTTHVSFTNELDNYAAGKNISKSKSWGTPLHEATLYILQSPRPRRLKA